MSGTSIDHRSATVLRPAFRLAWALVAFAVGALMVWGWVAFVPGFVRNPEIPYMEWVLSPILYSFLLLLMAAGSAVLAAAGFRSWDRRLRARSGAAIAVIRAEDLACYYAWIGDANQALDWLEYAFALSPIGVDQRVLRSAIFDRIWQNRTSAARVERILEGVWPRVKAAS